MYLQLLLKCKAAKCSAFQVGISFPKHERLRRHLCGSFMTGDWCARTAWKRMQTCSENCSTSQYLLNTEPLASSKQACKGPGTCEGPVQSKNG